MTANPQLFLEFESSDEFERCLETELKKGRAFVSGQYAMEPRQTCDLVVVHPQTQEWLYLHAEAVYVAAGEQPGIGLEILEPSDHLNDVLYRFCTDPPESSSSLESSSQTDALEFADEELSSSESRPGIQATSAAARVRGLNATGRDRIARRGTLAERIALERAYGASVWDSLLSNPLLSTAEVARIAKNHSASQPVLNMIVMNQAWLVKPEVRRALLSNPRLVESQVEKTLRALAAHELKLVPKQTAYPHRVRLVAKRLLGL